MIIILLVFCLGYFIFEYKRQRMIKVYQQNIANINYVISCKKLGMNAKQIKEEFEYFQKTLE
jgi:hypothetical protein